MGVAFKHLWHVFVVAFCFILTTLFVIFLVVLFVRLVFASVFRLVLFGFLPLASRLLVRLRFWLILLLWIFRFALVIAFSASRVSSVFVWMLVVDLWLVHANLKLFRVLFRQFWRFVFVLVIFFVISSGIVLCLASSSLVFALPRLIIFVVDFPSFSVLLLGFFFVDDLSEVFCLGLISILFLVVFELGRTFSEVKSEVSGLVDSYLIDVPHLGLLVSVEVLSTFRMSVFWITIIIFFLGFQQFLFRLLHFIIQFGFLIAVLNEHVFIFLEVNHDGLLDAEFVLEVAFHLLLRVSFDKVVVAT